MRTHGKRSTYKSGCRCFECGRANRNYFKGLQARKQASHVPDDLHGTFLAAQIHKCKCETCNNFLRLYKHGLTISQANRILEAQGGKCAICKAESKTLEVDHDHSCCSETSCGKCIRGFLCSKCNNAIARFDDNWDQLITAFKYLEHRQHPGGLHD